MNVRDPLSRFVSLAVVVTACAACDPGNVSPVDARADTRADAHTADTPTVDATHIDAMDDDVSVSVDVQNDIAPDVAPDVVTEDVTPDTGPTTLDLHEATMFDNPVNLADWPVTTQITEVDFQYMGMDGVHVEFSKRDGPGSWPDITPPGWTGPLEYTLGFVENIGGHWYASAAIEFWRGLDVSGGNVASDVGTMAQCTSFGAGSTCQVARNWYYDARWGALAGYQPATGEIIGVFVVAGNLRGVTDGSQSPVQERSNVVLVRMPDLAGATYRF